MGFFSYNLAKRVPCGAIACVTTMVLARPRASAPVEWLATCLTPRKGRSRNGLPDDVAPGGDAASCGCYALNNFVSGRTICRARQRAPKRQFAVRALWICQLNRTTDL